MTIVGCRAEVQKLMDVSVSDIDTIEKALQAHLDAGVPRKKAQVMAVEDALRELQGERQAFVSAVSDQLLPQVWRDMQAERVNDLENFDFQEPERVPDAVRYSKRDYDAVVKQYKGTDQWMKAPNGNPTKLTERQWVQVRTPQFKEWFGDWEKFAGMEGGVWADANGEVSKVVDENGEPRVVYHGASNGGFMEFRQPGGQKRGDIGIFTTDDWDMARSYVRKGRVKDIQPPDLKALAEEANVDFFEYQGRVSSKETEDRTLYGYSTPYGDEVDGFTSMEDAVADAAAEYVDESDREDQPGVYALFANLRNPNESDFEGAMWSGSREHQWIVEYGGEQQFDSDGKGFFDSQEEAADFAETFRSDDDEGEFDPLDYVTAAEDHYETTDDVARQGIKYGDGAIIRNVVDDGGGPGNYMMTPATVFVLKDPTQVKSADWNNGDFSAKKADLRYSTRQKAEKPKVKAEKDPAIGDKTDVSKLPAGRSIPASVAVGGLESTFAIARGKTYAKGRDLKMDIQDAVIKASKEAGVSLTTRSKALHKFLSDMVFKDAMYALKTNENAIGWYDQKVSRAIGAISVIHPEINTSSESRLAFLWALAVTSNGLKVDKNFELAESAYRQWKESSEEVAQRKMPTKVGIGNAAKAINEGLGLFNELTESMGHERAAKFMATEFPAGDIKRMLGIDPGGEWAGTPVRGAVILGPKIGNGFYMNLNGYFDALTMDRWLMRTFGRMTGTLLEIDRAAIDGARAKLKTAIAAMTLEQRKAMADLISTPIRKDLTRSELDDVAAALDKASMKPEKREVMQASPATNRFRLDARGLAKALDGQKEAPSGPAERNWIRAIFAAALDRLRAEGKGMTMSDLQALLWYPERRLYDAAKADDTIGEGYEDDDAPDYANAAMKLAIENGADREAVIKAMDEAEARGTVRAQTLTDAERNAMLREMRAAPEQPTQMAFEVAPDPADTQALAAWATLSAKDRADITKEVRDAVMGGIYSATGVELKKVVAATGGFAGLINPNLIGEYQASKMSYDQARQLASAIGYVLDQDSVALADPRSDQEVDIIRLTFEKKPGAYVEQIFKAIQEAVPEIDGFTLRGNNFDVLNFTNLSNGYIVNKIRGAIDALNLPFDVYGSAGKMHSELVERDSYGVHLEGLRSEYPEGVRGELDGLRDRSRQIVAAGIAARRGNAVRPGRAGAAGLAQQPAASADGDIRRSERDRRVGGVGGQAEDDGSRGSELPNRGASQGVGPRAAVGQQDPGVGGQGRAQGAGVGRGAGAQGGQESGLTPLPGAPTVDPVKAGTSAGPDARLVSVAERYARDNGIDLRRQSEYVQVDPERAKRIADAYEAMPHAPQDPKVKEAFENLIRQTTAQYRALEQAGYKFWLFGNDNDPYAGNPWAAMADLRENQSMAVYSTAAGFGTSADFDPANNPLLADTGIRWPYGSPDGELQPVYANDLFRAVHDAFGHGLEGSGFRARGEENAWQAHIRLFTGSAKGAITSETRGQNSWLNYGPQGAANQTASVFETAFADQKTGLMPEWTWTEGLAGDMPSDGDQAEQVTRIQYSNRDPLGYYSALARGIEGMQTKAALPGAWKAQIKGLLNKGAIKAEELEWTGLEDWLDLQEGKVAKDQILTYLQANGVKVEEVVLTDKSDADSGFYAEESPDDEDTWVVYNGDDEVVEVFDSEDEADQFVNDRNSDVAGGTKYGTYTLLGGENYREVLLTLPDAPKGIDYSSPEFRAAAAEMYGERYVDELAPAQKELVAKKMQGALGKHYQSSHWDQKNVLAHIRVNDRESADGSRVLFVEEVQSDWGQDKKKGKQVSDAPFIGKTDGWLNLALKRIITLAVDGGYDKVAFVNGQQSADRYDLSKQVQQVMASKEDGKFRIFMRDSSGKNHDAGLFAEEELEGVVGKELAGKIALQKKGVDYYEGEDLKVGGEGMITFYDKIVPNAVKALLKKVGGENLTQVDIGDTNEMTPYERMAAARDASGMTRNQWERIPYSEQKRLVDEFWAGKAGQMQPGFSITPAMREKVSGGQPLFSKRDQAAEAAGFDPSVTYYHGTTAKDFKVFKPGKGGVNELGEGIYFTTNPMYAEAWAGRQDMGGRIIPAYLKRGDIFDSTGISMAFKGVRSEAMERWWLPLARRVKQVNQPLSTEASMTAGSDELWRTWLTESDETLAEQIAETSKNGGLNTWLDRAGYIGRKDERSQIPGQVVVFRPEYIRTPWAKFNPKKASSGNLLYSQRVRQENSESFLEWSDYAPLVRSAQAESYDFKTGEKVVLEAFHGTGRGDRVGEVFQKKRATSGPMAYFTSNPDLASSYAKGKADTSLAAEESPYESWFKYQPKGQRTPVDIARAWSLLDAQTKATIEERMPDIRTDDDGNPIYEEGGGDIGSYEWNLKQTQKSYDRRGNPLAAAVETWLNSGALFGEEQSFMRVLQLAGFPVKDVTYDNPGETFPFVYKTYISMSSPLVTSDVPKEVKQALRLAAAKDRSRARYKEGVDSWDKNTRTLKDWVDAYLGGDEDKSKYVWTSIPDKVTAVFKEMGYDGIIDWSGKGGGTVHPVYIPFEETQVKSAIGNNGDFDRTKKSIMRSARNPQEDTPAFKAWFGDSKVVDADGRPLVMYHGTAASIEAFDPAYTGASWGADSFGFFFTSDPELASTYAISDGPTMQRVDGANVMPVYLSVQRPVTVEALEEFTGEYGLVERFDGPVDLMDAMRDDIVAMLIGNEWDNWRADKDSKPSKENTHDGVLFEFGGSVLAMAIDPTQIKSAISNNGDFDRTKKSIMRSARNPQEEAENFKRWFGDSKVVDAEGKPLVVYHGSASDFAAFDPAKQGTKNDKGYNGEGFYFSEDPDYASAYAEPSVIRGGDPVVYPVYVSIERPLIIGEGEGRQVWSDLGVVELGVAGAKEKTKAATSAGYDGVIVMRGEVMKEIIAFRPEQIKSATGNNGDFDPANPDIRRSARDAVRIIKKYAEDHADVMFRAPKTDAKDMATIVEEVASAYGFGKPFNAGGFDTRAEKIWGIPLKITHGGRRVSRDALIFEDGDLVWLDVSGLEPGDSGGAIYQAAGAYAHNNGKTFIGDPAGISPAGKARRLENMISLALKYGTTKFLKPHPKMGVPWTDDDDTNLATMLELASKTAFGYVPEAEEISYDHSTGKFSRDGADFGRVQFDRLAERSIQSASPAQRKGMPGSGALRLAVIFNSLASRPDDQGGVERGVFEGVDSASVFRNDSVRRMRWSQRTTGDFGRQYTPDQETFFRNVGRTADVPTLKQRLAEFRKDLGKKLAQGIADQFAPLKELGGDGYTLARLSKGASGAFEALLHHGKLSLKDGAYDADMSGGFVDTVGKALGTELEDFMWWIAANRADRLSQEDREHLFTPQDIAAGKGLATGQMNKDYVLANGQVTRDRALAYADALRKFDAFNKNVLDMAEQSGLIDGDARLIWDNEFYVPFYRVSEEDGAPVGNKVKGGIVRQRAFKQLKGGAQKLNSDLTANVMQNWAHLIDASTKNRAAKATLESAQALGIAIEAPEEVVRQMGKSMGNKNGVVWFLEDGKQRHFLVDDPYILEAINSLEYAGLRGPLMDALSKTKHWLTIGVTASPAFKVRNLIRDSLQAIAVADLSYNPLKNLKDGIKYTDRNNQDYVSALAAGGLMRFGSSEASQADRVRQLVARGVPASTILDTKGKLMAMYSKYLRPGIDAYQELGDRGEEINRMALYKQLRGKGFNHAQASLMARDLMDFSMQGTFKTVRFLTQVVPFLNARIQGLYKLGKSAHEDPKRFGVVVAAVALASITLMSIYGDDEDWKKREDWDRDGFWWLKFGGVAFRIPKPFEVGAIATIAERGVELFTNDEFTTKHFLDRVKHIASDNLSMNPVPQALKPLLDVYANKDSFSGRPIETLGMEKLQAEYRYTSATSLLARGMSTGMNAVTRNTVGSDTLSPVQIDSLIRGYTGWLGTTIVGVADWIVRQGSSEPSRPAPDWWKVASQNFLQEVPSGQSKYVSAMYDQLDKIGEAYNTHKQLIKEGKVEDAREFAADNKDLLARYRLLESVKKAVSANNKQIRAIEISDLDPQEKKRQIQALKERNNEVARKVY